MFAVEWSEWVVRLPGSGGSPVWTIALLLGAVFLISALLKSLSSAAGKLVGILGPLIGLFFAVLLLYGFNALRQQQLEPSGPDRTVVIGQEDCESQLVDRCPTQDPVAGG
jgi:apolipoprotein N-acyltransferase